MQQLLESRPDSDLAVFAVWLPALSGDSRSFWDPELLSDPRATHLWDAERAIGRWFGTREGSGLAWDVYYLLGPNAPLRTSRPLATGSPVVAAIGRLEAALAAAGT